MFLPVFYFILANEEAVWQNGPIRAEGGIYLFSMPVFNIISVFGKVKKKFLLHFLPGEREPFVISIKLLSGKFFTFNRCCKSGILLATLDC